MHSLKHSPEALRVESLEAEAGSDVTLNEVLMLGNGESVTLGAPLVANASCGQYHCPPARHALAPRSKRRTWQRSHNLCHGRGHGCVQHARRAEPQIHRRSAKHRRSSLNPGLQSGLYVSSLRRLNAAAKTQPQAELNGNNRAARLSGACADGVFFGYCALLQPQ